ncbi:uncharacterized protein C8A04DRAFT_31701 [Dichotomopilus funicola]|uniref:Uncharacterized protein n=1 Tax=Dichotomopilus funicola TaxID=1934379 RepID=A0AAN6ZKB4_9PEZI|nr:hypothetical protein C8A04DRAFT_31701 [Dichotomopilus funicola]
MPSPDSTRPLRRSSRRRGRSRAHGSSDAGDDIGGILSCLSCPDPELLDCRRCLVSVGLLALASTAAVVCAWFWPAPFFSVSANHVPAGWTGDPRVNLSISSLHPEDIGILAIPFPVADLATLPALWLKVYVRQSTTGPGEYKQVQALRAEHAPLAVDRANVTLTLELMETLWPVLIQAANDLLVLGLGRDHPDYRPLRNSLIEPGRTKPALLSLVRAKELWEGRLHSSALAWPYGAQAFLRSVRAFMQLPVEWRADNNNNNNSTIAATFPSIGSSQPPTSLRLLRHARHQHPPNQTLPGLLAGLQPSANTTGQLRGMMVALDSNLDINRLGLCRVPRLLEAIASGHCIRTKTSGMSIPCWAPLGSHCHPTDCMGGLREALCDAEALLSSVAAAAERAKARVLEERIVGRLRYRDGVARQLEKPIAEAVGRLKTKVSDGWLERLGLGDLLLEEEADGLGKPSEPLWSL